MYDPECVNSPGTTDYFFWRTPLNISPSIEETGGLVWWVVLCLLVPWMVVYLTMLKGIESSKWVGYGIDRSVGMGSVVPTPWHIYFKVFVSLLYGSVWNNPLLLKNIDHSERKP